MYIFVINQIVKMVNDVDVCGELGKNLEMWISSSLELNNSS